MEGVADQTFEGMRERIASMSVAERQARLVEVEREMRQLEAEVAVLVHSAERDRGFRADGHLTAGGYPRGEFRWSKQ